MKPVTFTSGAAKSLRKLPMTVRAQIEAKLDRYAATGAGDVKAMVGQNVARLRVGDYRAIFEETDDAIIVQAVGSRRDIYT